MAKTKRGRPSIGAYRRLMVQLPPEHARWIRAYARRHGISQSTAIRAAVLLLKEAESGQ